MGSDPLKLEDKVTSNEQANFWNWKGNGEFSF